MREMTLAISVPATLVKSEAQPQIWPAPDAESTVRLISLARDGDMSAFDQLMRRHERLVLMTALRFLHGNMADAQDAAQTVFLRLHRALCRFRNDASFPAWLYRITVNVCHDMNRRKQRRAEVELGPVARLRTEETIGAAIDFDCRRAALNAGLEHLGEKERAAIVLRDVEGLETREVASILNSSEATVRSQISVARRKLRAFCESYTRRQL
jgi:RNA polymerase sigma-70 factor (ECF subfamily)